MIIYINIFVQELSGPLSPGEDLDAGHTDARRQRVAYLSPADNSHGSLLGRLKGAHQPVITPRNRFSASCSSLLAGL